MNTRRTLLATGIATALIFVFALSVFMVGEGQIAVVTTFGRPTRTVDQTGFHLRWPRPIQQVHLFDRRMRSLEGPLEQVQTRDGESLIVSTFVGWQISDPLKFLQQNAGSDAQAARNLNHLLSTAKLATLGRHRLTDLLNPNPAELQFEQVETEMLAQVAPLASRLYGVEVRFAGLRKISLPEATTESVAAHIRAEREGLATRFRSEGEAEAVRITARAQSDQHQLLADAEARARRLEAEGDAEAAKYYEVFRQNPDLAVFLRKLESLERSLNSQSTVVLTDQTPPFDLLRGEEKETKPASKP
jgi:membrane protease subunit HflC